MTTTFYQMAFEPNTGINLVALRGGPVAVIHVIHVYLLCLRGFWVWDQN